MRKKKVNEWHEAGFSSQRYFYRIKSGLKLNFSTLFLYFQMKLSDESTRGRREHSDAFHQFSAWLVKWFCSNNVKRKGNKGEFNVQKHFKHHLPTILHNFLLITKLLLLNMLQGRRTEIWGWVEAYPTRKSSPFSSKIAFILHPPLRELHLKCNKKETFAYALFHKAS